VVRGIAAGPRDASPFVILKPVFAMKSIHFILLFSLLPLCQGLLASESGPPGEWTSITPELIDHLMVEAKSRNPGLEAAGARTDAAAEAVGSVRIWEDPTFSFGLWRSSSQGFSASEEGNIIYGIDQKLPVFGRPGLARDVAEAAAAREQLNADFEVQELRRDLTKALLELALDDRGLELAKDDLRWLEVTVTTLDSRYRVGKSSQVEWLKAQTERAKAASELTTLESRRDHQEVLVNRLLNRELHSQWPAVQLPGIAAPMPDDDQLIDAALGYAPKLKVLRQETAESEAAAKLTSRQRLPEIGVGAQARQYSGDGGIREGTLTVSFTLPWINGRRYDSDLRRDRAKSRAAERDAADYELGVREEVHHLTVDFDAARRQAVLYRDEIIPLTEQTLSSAQSAWESNLGAYRDVLEAHRMLVENRLVLAQSNVEQAGKMADLTFLTGIRDYSSLKEDNPRPSSN
jgi:cobalt-zinc-cadmium efflux system outer membrane protein